MYLNNFCYQPITYLRVSEFCFQNNLSEIEENTEKDDEIKEVSDPDSEVPKETVNVRSRVEQLVKSKFSDIVNELRRSSSPSVVKKWVDIKSSDTKIEDNSIIPQSNENECDTKLIQLKSDVDEKTDVLTKEDEEFEVDSSIKNRISFTSILTKLNLRAFERGSTETEIQLEAQESQESVKGSTITSTFSDFYERFSSNKERYQSIKNRKMDLKRLLSRNKQDESESQIKIESNKNEPEAIEPEKDESQSNIEPPFDDHIESSSSSEKFILDSSDTNIDWSLKPPLNASSRRVTRRLNRCASENQPSVGANRKTALSNIGRSFSVAAQDDADDNCGIVESSTNTSIFVTFHEGNNSCPNPSSLHASSKSIISSDASYSVNNHHQHMLPKSLPISPSHYNKCNSDDEHARKPDPEAILRACGFGPPRQEDVISRIPKRFLKPSQVRGIDTNEFLKRQKFANHLHDSSNLGYRGLIGNPHIRPSNIVSKIRERFQVNRHLVM
uniref:CSON014752 protein n=1 Tax=Culicoides sonorensis TaxID=179676 RepID=A0A336MBJ0_CULSO